MTTHTVVSHEEWMRASQALLAKEKAFTKEREAMARERRSSP